MTAIVFLLGHLRLAAYALAGLALLLLLGWIGHLVEQHRRDEAHVALLQQQLAGAIETNQQNMAELARFKQATEKAEAALGQLLRQQSARAASIASIRKEVVHVAPEAGPSAVGPRTLAALDRLRRLKAAAGDHAAAGREGGDSAGAAGLPARP